MQLDGWTDTRLFCLTADAGFSDRLENERTVAVRKNREGAFYLYMSPSGSLGASNALLGKDAAPSASYVPSSLADCSWYVKDITGWENLDVSPRAGEGTGSLVITTGINHSSQDRTGTITLTSEGGLQQKIAVHQTRSGADLRISQDTFGFSDAAGTQTLKIECNTDWEILGISSLQAYDTSWLKLSQLKGNGNAEVAISVLESFDDVERIARLTVSAGNLGDNYYNIVVTQQGKELVTMSTNVNSQTFAAAGSTKKVTVTSNGAWTATIPEGISWAHITPIRTE